MTPNERARALIAEARKNVFNPDSAPALVNHLVNAQRAALAEDAEVADLVTSVGWNKIVRDTLARHNAADADGPAIKEQLALWADTERAIVERINRARVYVPSRREHVELIPDALNAKEIAEAGAYLIALGEDTIRRGRDLRQLAELRGVSEAA
jgi:hypothetical protein